MHLPQCKLNCPKVKKNTDNYSFIIHNKRQLYYIILYYIILYYIILYYIILYYIILYYIILYYIILYYIILYYIILYYIILYYIILYYIILYYIILYYIILYYIILYYIILYYIILYYIILYYIIFRRGFRLQRRTLKLQSDFPFVKQNALKGFTFNIILHLNISIITFSEQLKSESCLHAKYCSGS